MKTSYGESLLRSLLKRALPTYKSIYNYRGEELTNPETGKPLELDIYFPTIKLAFEFQGIQHKRDEDQRDRDKIKRRICKGLGITVIEVWTSTLTGDLLSKIKSERPDVNVKKPPADFMAWFRNKADGYKKSIYKMNKELDPAQGFVKRRKKWSY